MTVTIANHFTFETCQYYIASYEENPFRVLAETLEEVWNLFADYDAEEELDSRNICICYDKEGNTYCIERASDTLYIVTDL